MRGKNVILEWSVRARFLEVFICCLFERTASEISSIKPNLVPRVLSLLNLVPRVLSLLRESTLVAAGHVSARFLQIPEM